MEEILEKSLSWAKRRYPAEEIPREIFFLDSMESFRVSSQSDFSPQNAKTVNEFQRTKK